MTTGSRKFHDFCWLNLMTPEGNEAKEFFASLFGWTFGEMPGVPGGHLILVEGKAAGALMDLQVCRLPEGTPPAIGLMVKVEDVDASLAKINSLGGKGDAPFDVMTNGRMAMVTDPNGAVFGLWQPKDKDGFDVDSHAHGAPGWFETISTDAARAAEFYAAAFGWDVEIQSPVPGMQYTLFKLGDVPVSGAMSVPNVPAHWSVAFSVRDADEVAKRLVELGGNLCMPVQAIAGVGRFALFKSPQGVSFQIMEWAKLPCLTPVSSRGGCPCERETLREIVTHPLLDEHGQIGLSE